MKVKFADTFPESLRYLASSQRWYNRAISFIRYDIIRFFKNVWRFRKPLYNHYWWDHHGTLEFLEVGLDHMAGRLEKDGLEIDISRMKKVEAIKRAVQLIKNYNQDLYIEMAEAELGDLILHGFEFEEINETTNNPLTGKEEKLYEMVDRETPEEKKHNSKIYKRAREIEEKEWNELFRLLRGQDHKDYKKFTKTLTEEQRKERDTYYEWFDGSGLKGWWD